MKKLIYFLVLIACIPSLKGQFAAVLTHESFTRLENDSVILVPDDNLRGTIQWQKSIDSVDWTDVEANLPGDTLAFVPAATEAYRMQITEGTCSPLYTEPVKLFSKNTTLSEYLSDDEITLSDLLAGGVSVTELYDEGILVGILEQNGADSADLANAGLIGVVTDYENNTYKWVRIYDQIWMAENLKVTKYNDGSIIPLEEDGTNWSNLTTPGFCWFSNDSAAFADPYGALYNWYALDTLSNGNKNVCPSGWHLPSYEEWNILADTLGGYGVTGGKIKEAGFEHWWDPNTGADNETGFTALPGGARYFNGSFMYMYSYGYWWSSTGHSIDGAWGLYIIYNDISIYPGEMPHRSGASVRCVKN